MKSSPESNAVRRGPSISRQELLHDWSVSVAVSAMLVMPPILAQVTR